MNSYNILKQLRILKLRQRNEFIKESKVNAYNPLSWILLVPVLILAFTLGGIRSIKEVFRVNFNWR